MRRRKFITLVGAAIVRPAGVRAQQDQKLRTVGILTPHLEDPAHARFFDHLRELGYEDGRNVRILLRSADSKVERLPDLAAELVNARVDVILAIYTPGARAAINATKEIPIVMAIVGDPVGTGLVNNLARPGGNVTGISNMSGELASKRLQLFKEALPLPARRIAAIFNSDDPITAPQIRDTEQTAQQLGVEVRFFAVRSQLTLASAFKDLHAWQAQGVLWLAGQTTPFIAGTVALATEHRLPLMVVLASDARAGGLISYFADHRELFKRAAVYVDKILKGANPGDLPVEQPTKFELVINLKTAKALGITVPAAILGRADEVIE